MTGWDIASMKPRTRCPRREKSSASSVVNPFITEMSAPAMKAFIAGADISVMKGFTTLEALDFSLLGQRVLGFIEAMSQPVIGAINGFAPVSYTHLRAH